MWPIYVSFCLNIFNSIRIYTWSLYFIYGQWSKLVILKIRLLTGLRRYKNVFEIDLVKLVIS